LISGADNNLISKIGSQAVGSPKQTAAPTGASFADTLKGSIDEVSRLQQDASKAVEGLTTGKNDDVTGVMTAVEKSDLAFQTLLAIRAKLMDAYDEIKNIAV
jgi:flagellar hook-basal body complex protein FliE